MIQFLFLIRSGWRAIPAWAVALVLLLGLAGGARAQVIDRIDVVPAGAQAEIRIQFTTQIQYQRHSPTQEGALLRIFLMLTGQDGRRDEQIQETKPGPRSPLVAPFTVTFPDAGALLVRFARDTTFRVRPGEDGRSIIVSVPSREQEPAAPGSGKAPGDASSPVPAAGAAMATQSGAVSVPQFPTPVPISTAEVETLARRLIDESRKAMVERNGVAAVERLNQLLNLPPNAASEAAQALAGEAREMNGEIAKARAEYELYLRLYPQGSEVPKVRQLLAQIGDGRPGPDGRPRRDAPPPKWVVSGSVFQYWYGGKSQTEITTTTPGLTFNRETLTAIDQRALVSTVDFNARQRTETTDTRIVVRDTHTANFLGTLPDRNRLNAAYVERTDQTMGYLVRAGRQPGNAGGVLGRFDGLWLGYSVAPRWRVNVVGGTPVEFNSPYRRNFYGLNVDLIPQINKWGGNFYYVNQSIDGVTDRRAVGTELRYFDERRNGFSMIDYDLSFKRINIAMLQANWQSDSRTNWFALLDHRRSPPFSVTNGLMGQSLFSVKAFLETSSLQTLREQSLALTSSSNLAMIGFTHPYSERWQLGADVRVSNISGTGAVGEMPASPGTGNIMVYSGQAIGNTLLKAGDFGVVNLSLISALTYKGQSVSLNYVRVVSDRLRVDGILRYYGQKDTSGIALTRVTPSVKGVYKIGDRWYLEMEAAIEMSDKQGADQHEKARRHYAYFGYRWDFY